MTASAIDTPAGVEQGRKGKSAVLRIAVIVVHYKTPQMLKECIGSLFPELDTSTSHPDHIFIVDNASGAADVAALDGLAGNPAITLIASPKNLGFAGANDLAIEHIVRAGGADYYLLLNPDTLVRANAVTLLLHFLQTHPEVPCVGPRLEDLDGTPQQSAFTHPTPISEFLRGASIGPLSRMLHRFEVAGPIQTHPVRTDWLAGACILMRSPMVDIVGPLDGRFFMYFEEVDFFRRARRCNLPVWYEPAAHVVHLVGKSSGITVAQGQRRLPGYWFESRHRYFRKHFGYLGMLAADMFWFSGHFLDRLRKTFTGTSHAPVAEREAGDLLRHMMRQVLHPFAARRGEPKGAA